MTVHGAGRISQQQPNPTDGHKSPDPPHHHAAEKAPKHNYDPNVESDVKGGITHKDRFDNGGVKDRRYFERAGKPDRANDGGGPGKPPMAGGDRTPGPGPMGDGAPGQGGTPNTRGGKGDGPGDTLGTMGGRLPSATSWDAGGGLSWPSAGSHTTVTGSEGRFSAGAPVPGGMPQMYGGAMPSPHPGHGAPNSVPPAVAPGAGFPTAQSQPNVLPPGGGLPNALPPSGTAPNTLPGLAPANALPPQGTPGMNAYAAPAALAAGAAPTSVTLVAPQTAAAARLAAEPHAVSAGQGAPGNVANPRADAAALAAQAMASMRTGQASLAHPAPLPMQGAAAIPAARAQAGMGSAQAVMQAQAALALAVGRMMVGQTTAGAGAMALAEAQMALRASKLALTQATLAAQAGTAARAGTSAQTQGLAQTGPQGRAAAGSGTQQAAGQLAGASARGAAMAQAMTSAKAAAAGADPAAAPQIGPASMPRALATALAMAPKLRKRGSHGRVEAVSRDMPGRQSPEMEDEDFWDGLADDEQAAAAAGEPLDEAEMAAAAAAQHYRAMITWLGANDEPLLMRELAAGRRVLVLAPPDKTHQRLIGHLLRPDAAQDKPMTAPGTAGRAWALAARWTATLPTDVHWRQWRVRQSVDADGIWHVSASQPDRHTPRILLGADGAANSALPVVGEHITILDPRRLRRLMGSQWTLTVLRVPVPLNDKGPVEAAA